MTPDCSRGKHNLSNQLFSTAEELSVHLTIGKNDTPVYERPPNTILLHSWPQVENSSIVSVTRENSQRKMHHRPSDKSLKRLTTSTNAMSSIEVCGRPTLGRLAISDPLRRYRGDVATGRRSLVLFEGEVVTTWETVGRASKIRNAQTPFGDMIGEDR
jgi:hypothetical protein